MMNMEQAQQLVLHTPINLFHSFKKASIVLAFFFTTCALADYAEVEAVCNEVMILHHGTVRLQGRISELLSADNRFYLRISSAAQAQQLPAA